MSGHINFDGRTYAILGASGGIGSEIARELAEHSANLVVASREASAYDAFDWAGDAQITSLDARSPDEVEDWIHDTAPQEGFSGVVNAVGSIDLKPIHRTSYDTWHETIELNLTTCFALLRAYVDHLPEDGGSFLAFSSAAAGKGLPNHGAIAAAKAGVEGLVRSAAATYANQNLRANCISPGLVETDLSAPLLKSERARERSEDMHALGRIGKPKDPAQAALWLLNPENDWVTGQVIGVDGGLRSLEPK